MKIYFTTSLSGKDKFIKNYKLIYQILEYYGARLITDHILAVEKNEILNISDDEERDFYEKLKEWINEADIVIAEVTNQSTSVGHEISLALFKDKPVILLYTQVDGPALFRGMKSDKLQSIKYNFSNLEKKLIEALDIISGNREIRFNFFIAPKHQNYLNWISRNKKIPRSVFLRKLINNHINHNPDYSK